MQPQFVTFYPDLAELKTSYLSHGPCSSEIQYEYLPLPGHLAQPFRYIAHNGEINTLRRNTNNMKARETSLSS